MGPKEIAPQQRLRDVSNSETPLEVLAVKFEGNGPFTIGANVAPVGRIYFGSLRLRVLIPGSGMENAHFCSCIHQETASRKTIQGALGYGRPPSLLAGSRPGSFPETCMVWYISSPCLRTCYDESTSSCYDF